MGFLISIFRGFWAIYTYIVIAIVVIFSSIIVFFTSLLFGGKAKKFNLFLCLHVSSPAILLFSGIFLKTYGRENIEPKKGYVLVSNHSSYMDIFANPTSVPVFHLFTYLAKAELGKTPVFGVIARNLAVLVNRKSMESRKKSFTYMKKVLNEGISVFLYPEGTRNKSNEPLLPFFDGAFKLAKDMNVPIIVCTLVNMRKRNDINKFLDMSPGRLYCYIEAPIDVNQYTIEELKEMAKSKMLERLSQH